MDCPSCNGSSLKLIKLQDSLPARECRQCQGVLIDLVSYRAWRESQVLDASPAEGKTNRVVADNSKALACPKCAKLMLKYRVTGEQANKVDICTNCDEAWLDEGEWALLGELALQGKLTAIFTEPWQRQLREAQVEASIMQRNEALLGKEDYARLMEIKAWIQNHPKQKEVQRILLTK